MKSSGRGRSRRRPSTPSSMANREYRDGIVMVHGVGHQKRGDTLQSVAPRLAETLSAQGLATVFTRNEAASEGILEVEGGKHMLIAEAYWADIVAEGRIGGTRGALLRVRFAFSAMPYLVVGVLGPRDHHGEAATERPSSSRLMSSLRSIVGIEPGEFARVAPLAWRILPLYGLAVAVTALFGLAWWAGLSAVALTLSGLLIVLVLPGSIVEHVRMASDDGAELQRICDRVSACISSVEERCERVWVIAHSQGGFIAHSLLAETASTKHRRVTRLTGIASGLRPIRLSGLATSWRVLTSSWMVLLGSALMTVGVLHGMEPDGFFGFAVLGHLMSVVAIMFVLPSVAVVRPDVVLEVFPRGFSMGWNGLPMAIAGLVIVGAALLLRRGTPDAPLAVPDLHRRIRWEEISSPSDLVGSMSIPELPDRVSLVAAPSIRNALFDHGLGAYFSKHGSMRFLISSAIADLTVGKRRGRSMALSSSLVQSHLEVVSRQLYVFRGSLVAAVLFFMIGVPAIFGASVLALVPTVVVPCLVASLLGWAFAYWRWRRLAPIAVATAVDEDRRGRRKLDRAIRRPARESVILLQITFIVWSIVAGIGLAAIFENNGAAVRLIEVAMMLTAGLICLVSRMGRPKLWTLAALLFAQDALMNLVDGILPGSVVGAPGVLTTSLLVIALIVHLCRRTYPARSSPPTNKHRGLS